MLAMIVDGLQPTLWAFESEFCTPVFLAAEVLLVTASEIVEESALMFALRSVLLKGAM